MPVTRKKVTRKKEAGSTRAKVEVSLPEELSVPLESIADYSILIFGAKKIGKTTMCSHFPDALFLMFEPGGKALKIYQRPVMTWDEFRGYVDLLENDDKFKTVIVDTVDLAYERCFQYVCKRRGISHPNEERDFGNTWKEIVTEFTNVMTRLMNCGKGVIFLSHDKVREFVSWDGESFDQIVPTMPRQAGEFFEGVVDVWAYYGYKGNDRYLVICGNDTIRAGNRLQEEDEHFMTAEGERIVAIPMGSTSREAYKNFLAAFNNEQDTDGGEMFRTRKKKVAKKSE